MTPIELQLWLRTSPAEHASAIAELIEAGDLHLVEDDTGQLRLVRAHLDMVTRLESGTLPALPAGTA
jgi:hypothetical protein